MCFQQNSLCMPIARVHKQQASGLGCSFVKLQKLKFCLSSEKVAKSNGSSMTHVENLEMTCIVLQLHLKIHFFTSLDLSINHQEL